MNSKAGYRSLFDINGKVVVVTGGNGILGRKYVEALADFGARIVIVDLDEAQSFEHAEKISKQYNVEAHGIGVDIADPVGVEAMAEEIDKRFGCADILLNNAASKGDDLEAFFAPTEEYDLETWRQIMSVNLDGAFLVAQAIGKRMAQGSSGGSIINVSSIYGNVGPDQRIYDGSEYMGMQINTPAVYSASKAGIIGLTRYLATLWGSRNVRVNCLTPGGVKSGQNEVFLRRYSDRTPLGRMADDSEMIGAVIFLASSASSYVTGHNLVVDGGWSIW